MGEDITAEHIDRKKPILKFWSMYVDSEGARNTAKALNHYADEAETWRKK